MLEAIGRLPEDEREALRLGDLNPDATASESP
jgi:hypothetical protein